MSILQAQRREDLKYPQSTQLLKSSKDLGWSSLVADLRSHSRCEGPAGAAPHAEAAVQNALVQVSLHGVPATAVITTNIARFTTDVGTILLGARRDEVVAARERADRLWPSIAGFIIGCCVGAVCEARFGLRALALPAGFALLALATAAKSNAAEAQVAALSVPDPDRQK